MSTAPLNFITKPQRGWLHPDQHLLEGGVCYGVRYVGCLTVKMSMKTLDFDTRTQVAKESISRVCESAGLKAVDKKKKCDRKIWRMLADTPNMQFAGSNINFTISTESLSIVIMETGEIIATHPMQGISFASGGDAETVEFVAYVGKNGLGGRACYVLECGGGLAQDVITTIGQAFELRFREYVKNRSATILPDRTRPISTPADPEYYNDMPPPPPPPLPPLPRDIAMNVTGKEKSKPPPPPKSPPPSKLSTPHSKKPLSQSKQDDLSPLPAQRTGSSDTGVSSMGDSCASSSGTSNMPSTSKSSSTSSPSSSTRQKDSINGDAAVESLEEQVWYHGPITRKESEGIVMKDGDFLVRASTSSSHQFVLTGVQDGQPRHLLLIDPDGKVRTRDRTFPSITHLVSHHHHRRVPILSSESSLLLLNPVAKKKSSHS